MTLTPSHIIEYLFCPRYTYFEYVLHIPQNEEKYYKVLKGRELHERKEMQAADYLRSRIGVVKKEMSCYLTDKGLRGEVDEVLWLRDGTMAPLDYKFAKYQDRVYETYQTQLVCYALLIEANYGLPVNRGYLVYTRSRNKLVEIEIDPLQKEAVKKKQQEILEIIEHNKFPKATRFKKRCVNCTYRNICIK